MVRRDVVLSNWCNIMIKAEFRVIDNSDLIDESEVMLEVENRYFVLKRDTANFLLKALTLVDHHDELKELCEKHDTSIETTIDTLKKTALLKEQQDNSKVNVRGFILRTDILSVKFVESLAKKFYILLHPALFASCVIALILTVIVTLNDIRYYFNFGFIDQANIWGKAFTIYLASILWHEIGHASASWRYARKCGKIGFGVYYVFPVFYADVSVSWIMKRKHRVITALSGVYFQLVSLVLILNYGHYMNDPSYFLASFFIIMSIFWTLNPVFKFDGYWALLDFIGDKDLRKTAASNIINERKTTRKFIGSLIYSALSLLYLFLMVVISIKFIEGIIFKFIKWQQNNFRINIQTVLEKTTTYDALQFIIHLIILLGSIELARRCFDIATQIWKNKYGQATSR